MVKRGSARGDGETCAAARELERRKGEKRWVRALLL